MDSAPPSTSLVRSVAIAVDEDLDEAAFAALLRSTEVRPRAYLAELALVEPTQAQVNLASDLSLGLDPSPQGLLMLATFMEKVAPVWSLAWYADCAFLTPAARSEAP